MYIIYVYNVCIYKCMYRVYTYVYNYICVMCVCMYIYIYIYIYACVCVCVSVPAWNIEIPVLDGVSIRSYVWQQEGEVQTNYFTGWYWEV